MTAQGFDLATAPDMALEDQGTIVHLRDVTGKPLWFIPAEGQEQQPVTATIVGTYAVRYRQTMDAQAKKAAATTGAYDADVARQNQRALVAGCVLGWTGIHENGQQLACTPENVERILVKAPYIQEQLQQAMVAHERFFSRPSLS